MISSQNTLNQRGPGDSQVGMPRKHRESEFRLGRTERAPVSRTTDVGLTKLQKSITKKKKQHKGSARERRGQ